jgi:hypothetical protein
MFVLSMSHAEMEEQIRAAKTQEDVILFEVLLRELPELKFEFFRRIYALLHQKSVHGINRSSKTVVSR